jgi:hypothetical protein
MNRRGVEFTLTQVHPGLWKWQFQIGKTVTTGKTQSNLMGMAARRVFSSGLTVNLISRAT